MATLFVSRRAIAPRTSCAAGPTAWGKTLYARYLCSRDALGLKARPSAARDDRVSCIQMATALFYQGAPGPRGQKGVIGDWGEDILVVVDPATGTKTKEFDVWVIRISEVLNNPGRKRRTWIGGKLIKKLFCN